MTNVRIFLLKYQPNTNLIEEHFVFFLAFDPKNPSLKQKPQQILFENHFGNARIQTEFPRTNEVLCFQPMTNNLTSPRYLKKLADSENICL